MLIEQIEYHAFDDLGKLRKLVMDGNKMRSIPETSFRSLRSLTSLDITGCQLQRFPDLTGLLRNVYKISLSWNQIEDITSI